MAGGEDDDLSPYERLRLERIKANETKMTELGLGPLIAAIRAKVKVPQSKRRAFEGPTSRPTRRSPRLVIQTSAEVCVTSDGEPGDDELDDEVSSYIDYHSWPSKPEQLDDDEFLCYAALKKWRLWRHRELDIEAYKLFPNRVFCEAVRRRRNDSGWAATATVSLEKTTTDLLLCWGIGPSKAAPDGFGFELASVLTENESNLAASRLRTLVSSSIDHPTES